jgi:hypothetical protein
LFRNAVQQDPKFAVAWGELAVVQALNAFWGIDNSPERLAHADAAIAQAVRLAPDAPEVIESLGTYAYYGYRDYARATEQYEKLARLQPNNPAVYSSLGLIQRRQGRWAESLVNLRRAVGLDPHNVGYVRNLLSSFQSGRHWDEQRAAHERLIALLPDLLREPFDLADAEFAATGSWKAADELLARLSPAQRDSPIGICFRKNWASLRDDYAEFKRLDALQPSFEDEEDPTISAIIAASTYFAHRDTAAVRSRLAVPLAEWRTRAEREPANTKAVAFVGSMEALLGNSSNARQLIRNAADTMSESRDALDGPIYRFYVAWVDAVTGDKDQAIAELDRVLQTPGAPFSVALIRAMPAFAKLRGDPRFEVLLADPKNNAPLF